MQPGRHGYIRCFCFNARAFPAAHSKSVYDSVFDTLSTKLGITDFLVFANEVDSKAAIHRDVLLPVKVDNAIVKFVSAGSCYLINMENHPVRDRKSVRVGKECRSWRW